MSTVLALCAIALAILGTTVGAAILVALALLIELASFIAAGRT
jgi:hypothetical protein